MGRPVDWSPLAAADPVPGEPDEAERAGRQFVQKADRIEHVARRVRAAADGLDMSSLAVLAFRDDAYRTAADVLRAHDKFRGTGQALLAYAPQHRQAQDESLAALRRAQQAEAQMHSAQRMIDVGQAALDAAAPGADTTQETATLTRGNALLAEAQQELEAARRRLDATVEIWQRAARQAMSQIDDLILAQLVDALGHTLAFTLGQIDTLADFFGDAWDLAADVWGMVNPWGANSFWGRVTKTADTVLGPILDGLTHVNAPRIAKYAGRAGVVTAFAGAGLAQYFRDTQAHPNMEADERAGRIAAQSATVGGAAVTGGSIGTAIGFGVGALFGGGGAIPGAIIGGVIGSTVASTVVDKNNDSTVRAVGNATDAAGDWTVDTYQGAKDWTVDTGRDVADWGGQRIDDAQQWGTEARQYFANHDFGKTVDDLNPLPWP